MKSGEQIVIDSRGLEDPIILDGCLYYNDGLVPIYELDMRTFERRKYSFYEE